MNKEDIRHLIESGILSMRGEFLRTPKQLNLPLTEDGLLSIEFESDHVDVEKVIELTINFSQLPNSFRTDLQKPIYQAYLNSIEVMADEFETAQHQLDWEAEMNGKFTQPLAPTSDAEIWSLVKFNSILIKKNYVILSGECAWDGEHGIALFFKNGNRFTKIDDVNAWVD